MMWQNLKDSSTYKLAHAQRSVETYETSVARCERGIQECKAQLAEFIGK